MARQQLLKIQLAPRSLAYLRKMQGVMEKAAFLDRIVGFFDRQAQLIAGQIVRTSLSGPPKTERSTSLKTNKLRRRTGTLARSLVGRGEVFKNLPAFRVGILRGPALRYADVLERGTVGAGGELPTIRPRKAKALAVPIDEALTPAGVHRFLGPRDAPVELKFVPFRRGIAVGKLVSKEDFEREEARADREEARMNFANIRSYYLLLRQVDIAPRHYLRDGVRAALPALTRALSKFIHDTLVGLEPKTA